MFPRRVIDWHVLQITKTNFRYIINFTISDKKLTRSTFLCDADVHQKSQQNKKQLSSTETSLLSYVPYVLPCPKCLVLHVPSCSACLVPCVSRTLHALVSHVPRVIRFSRALHALRPTYLVPYVLLCFTCPLLYVASCLALYETFFLTYLAHIVSYLAYSMS